MSIKEAFESGEDHLFYKKLSDHILELEKLRDYLDDFAANGSEISIIASKKLTKIIEKL